MRPTEPISIDDITFDALISLDENWDADVPAYPVETGFEVSDTITLRPIKLSMTLYLTNTPVTWKQRHGVSPHRVQDVIHNLRELYFRKTPITVSTSEADHTNMAITSIGLPKKIATGTSREIPITFQQVRTVEATTTTIPASLGRGGATGVNAGVASINVRPAPATNADSSQSEGSRGSILYNLSSSAGLLGASVLQPVR